MGQGELQSIVTELNEFLQQEQEKQGDLNEQERSLYNLLQEEQQELNQLKNDVISIAKLDKAIDDALGTLMDQINKARQFEKQAWDNFKEIARQLSDIKAREIYYMMEGAGRNIKNISLYLEKDFSTHFMRLVAEAKKHTSEVLMRIQSLKEKGVDFKKKADRIAQQEREEKERADLAAQEEEEAAKKPKAKKQGWLDWVLSFPTMVYNKITSFF
jgi:hypothetical protein